MKTALAISLGVACLFGAAIFTASLAQNRTDTSSFRNPAPGQLRGIWVDAFGPGLRSPQEIDQLVNDVQTMKLNAIFAQVGRRGDCYCNNAGMPRTQDPAVPAGFDPLAYLLEKAHGVGIQVHAWIITTAIHNDTKPPNDSNHVFNTHGLTKTGRDNWLMVRSDGATRAGNDFLLDPGHPDAAEYITKMYSSVVQNYAVDGIQFDRVRYPDQNIKPLEPSWGYNPVALERFQKETKRSDTPVPTDPAWMQWRREQVSNLVRRTYLEVKKIRPSVWVSAATITYGAGPADMLEFVKTRTYSEVLQDWAGWVKNGFLDLNIPMNYKRNHVPDQAKWFDQWNTFAKQIRGSRYVAPGTAIYLNSQEGSVAQAKLVLETAGLDGWVGYSYRTTDENVNAAKVTVEEARPQLIAKFNSSVFAQPAGWGVAPANRLSAISGRVLQNGIPADAVNVELFSGVRAIRRTKTDANGYFGFTIVPTGQLEVRTLDFRRSLEVKLGAVTDVGEIK
jgi:uncharacterized lipoprotein YddW (UPF0748 family)